jgi:hypothetical protein
MTRAADQFRVIGRSGQAVATGLLALLVTSAVAAAHSPQAERRGPVTFTKDVAPILQRSCQKCHHPGSIAPMSLLTYEEVRPWARSIKLRVSNREMPPWFIDRTVGVKKFKDDPSLTDEEIAAIVKWVDAGSPMGDPADMPAPRAFPNETDRWHIGQPDLVVTMPAAHVVPADGADWWGYYMADLPLTEDRYIKAIEVKPGNHKVVHHGNAWVVQDGEPDNAGTPLEQYSVGKHGDIYPDGTGKLLKAGGRISFHLHYHSIGEELRDQTSVGFVFYPKGYVPTHALRSEALANHADLDIPAGADDVRHDSYSKLEKPARFLAYGPHMHNRGKKNCVELIYPDARREILNCLTRYDFGWQILYPYADDVTPLVPAGTIVHSTSWYDNSSANRYNPDPKNWVGYGQRSNDEMNLVYIDLVYLTEQEFKAAVETRARQQQAGVKVSTTARQR